MKKIIIKIIVIIGSALILFGLGILIYNLGCQEINRLKKQITQKEANAEECYNIVTEKNNYILELEQQLEEKDKIIQENQFQIEELEVQKQQLSDEITTLKKKSTNTGILTKSKGVNYFNGHKETWYSQKVLPGGGLKIPGRHVAEDGTIRDIDNYICVASSDYPKGTIVETSLGMGKVYDSGCDSGTIDIYTDW